MKHTLATVILCFLLATLGPPVHADILDGITIAPENTSLTYLRADYKHWSDFDRDKLSTRHEVLEEESLVPVAIIDHRGKRIVTQGLWVGPFTGLVTTDPSKLQVDHMVPLKEAHESGAWAWDADKKERYANDLSNPNHLIAVKGGANGSKGDRDPADWMPPNRAYWCQYLSNWVEIKRLWALTMDQREADAVKKGAVVCKKYVSGDHLDGRH